LLFSPSNSGGRMRAHTGRFPQPGRPGYAGSSSGGERQDPVHGPSTVGRQLDVKVVGADKPRSLAKFGAIACPAGVVRKSRAGWRWRASVPTLVITQGRVQATVPLGAGGRRRVDRLVPWRRCRAKQAVRTAGKARLRRGDQSPRLTHAGEGQPNRRLLDV